MNASASGPHLLAGAATTRPTALAEPGREGRCTRTRLITQPRQTPVGRADTAVRFVQPLRFTRARQRRVLRSLRRKIALGGLLFTVMVMMMLAWKAAEGVPVSTGQWLLGVCSGAFIMMMMRLALFASLSAPSFIRFREGGMDLSGLGLVNPQQVLHWSLARGVVRRRQKPHARLEMSLSWLGQEKSWTMCLEEGEKADQLRQMLKAACAARRVNEWSIEETSETDGAAAAMASGLFVPLRS